MPYQGVGARHVVPASPAHKACVHGQIVTEQGFVGAAFKTAQPAWNVLPAAADDIATTEEFVIQLGGTLEAPVTGGMASAAVGDGVYIDPANNALTRVVTGGATRLRVGRITEIDVSRTPNVARINANVAGELPVATA
jgi:hypothetical protein